MSRIVAAFANRRQSTQAVDASTLRAPCRSADARAGTSTISTGAGSCIVLLVRDRTLAATMTRHFTTLIERSVLHPLPV